MKFGPLTPPIPMELDIGASLTLVSEETSQSLVRQAAEGDKDSTIHILR